MFLVKTSLSTFESCAEPSHPLRTYINCRSKSQAPKTFCDMNPLRLRKLGASHADTVAKMCVPSMGPTQSYILQIYILI